jgi:hypothetical protein
MFSSGAWVACVPDQYLPKLAWANSVNCKAVFIVKSVVASALSVWTWHTGRPVGSNMVLIFAAFDASASPRFFPKLTRPSASRRSASLVVSSSRTSYLSVGTRRTGRPVASNMLLAGWAFAASPQSRFFPKLARSSVGCRSASLVASSIGSAHLPIWTRRTGRPVASNMLLANGTFAASALGDKLLKLTRSSVCRRSASLVASSIRSAHLPIWTGRTGRPVVSNMLLAGWAVDASALGGKLPRRAVEGCIPAVKVRAAVSTACGS